MFQKREMNTHDHPSSNYNYKHQLISPSPFSLLHNHGLVGGLVHGHGLLHGKTKRLGSTVCSSGFLSCPTPHQIGLPFVNVNATILSGVLSGQRQSPINIVDIRTVAVPSAGTFIKNYKPIPATLISSGHDIQVDWIGDAGGIIINGSEYKLEHCHWHIPAEHTLDGTQNVMELHIVHTNSLGNIAVVGVLYKFGLPDPFLGQFYPHLISAANHEDGTDVGIVDPNDIPFDSSEFYRYNGSLTTPPYSETVLWTVIKKVNTVSREQVRALQNAVNDDVIVGNARPVQPLNGRIVHLHKPINSARII